MSTYARLSRRVTRVGRLHATFLGKGSSVDTRWVGTPERQKIALPSDLDSKDFALLHTFAILVEISISSSFYLLTLMVRLLVSISESQKYAIV